MTEKEEEFSEKTEDMAEADVEAAGGQDDEELDDLDGMETGSGDKDADGEEDGEPESGDEDDGIADEVRGGLSVYTRTRRPDRS